MTLNTDVMIQAVSAHLWDGQQKIRGTLKLTKDELVFEFEDFGESHLDLRIPLNGIIQVTSFLIFDQARKGLKIVSIDDAIDLFILEDPLAYRKALLAVID